MSLPGRKKTSHGRENEKGCHCGRSREPLRENIVANFNKYHQDRKHCPIYAKESLKRVYDAYHNLGGNDVATALYEKVLNMPEEPETTEKERSDEDDE